MSRGVDLGQDRAEDLKRRFAQVTAQHTSAPPLSHGDDGGTYEGMERVWEKLAEHDKRFGHLDSKLDQIDKDLSGLKFWIVGTALTIIIAIAGSTVASLGLVYAARQDTTATMSTALAAIQTVLAARPPEAPSAPAQPPTVILVPQQGPGTPPAQVINPTQPQQ